MVNFELFLVVTLPNTLPPGNFKTSKILYKMIGGEGYRVKVKDKFLKLKLVNDYSTETDSSADGIGLGA